MNIEQKLSFALQIMNVANFNLYDREETLGVEIGNRDANNREELQRLFDEYRLKPFLDTDIKTVRSIADAIYASLVKEDTDFSEIIQLVEEEDTQNAERHLPYEWNLSNPRILFEESYKWIYRHFSLKIPELMEAPTDAAD